MKKIKDEKMKKKKRKKNEEIFKIKTKNIRCGASKARAAGSYIGKRKTFKEKKITLEGREERKNKSKK